MAIKGNAEQRVRNAYVDIGGRDGQVDAEAVLDILGLGTPVQGLAGNGAAGAALDITALAGRNVRFEAGGDMLVRFQTAIGNVVTAAIWHFSIHGGHGRTVHLHQQWTHVSAWGLGGAWNFNIFPVDGV